jgi:glycerol-3-phosphate dehydrogenase
VPRCDLAGRRWHVLGRRTCARLHPIWLTRSSSHGTWKARWTWRAATPTTGTVPAAATTSSASAAPYLTSEAVGGVLVEGEGVIDPFWTTRAYCENAVRNGAAVYLGHGVTAMTVESGGLTVQTSDGATFTAQVVVNAAGLWADEVARLAGDDSFHLRPRKGQFIFAEEDHGVAQIILPVPSKISKGILVVPVVFGGVLLGPTAEDIADKGDVGTTADGLRRICEGVGQLVPAMATISSIRQFAALRTVSSTGGYIIGPSTVSRHLVHVTGIRSTGLSASPAIGRHVAELVRAELGLSCRSSSADTLPELPADARDFGG